jgi:thiosulfate dehydrogenase
VPAAELGRRLFADPKLSTSPFNRSSCATCHDRELPGGLPAAAPDGTHPGTINAGYGVANSVHRPSWWGGDELRLLDAVNVCLTGFMGGRPLGDGEDQTRQIYEFLAARSPDPAPAALPLTVVRTITDLGDLAGDPERGRGVFARACHRCHGDPHTGAGRTDPRAVPIPESTIATFPTQARSAVVEKVRHGRFFGVGGVMPMYSLEVLADGELADLLRYVGL